MQLEFIADRVGRLEGVLIISATSNSLVETQTIPLTIDVQATHRGLSIPESRKMDCGTYVAGHGRIEVALPFPTDDADERTYALTATDLSSGNRAVPLRLLADEVTTRKDAGGKVSAIVELGAVAAGEYVGTVTATNKAFPKKWQSEIRLVVSEPLTTTDLELGELEVGDAATGQITLRNAADVAVADIEFASRVVVHEPNDRSTTALSVRATPDKSAVDRRGERRVSLEITVPRDCAFRGDVNGLLVVKRGGVIACKIPVRLTILDPGTKPAPFQAAPQKLSFVAAPREVVEFRLRLKASPQLKEAITLSATLEELKPFENRRPAVADWEWPNKAVLRPRESVELKGSFVVPSVVGSFTGEVVISSSLGVIRVPLAVEVRQ